MLVLNQSLIPEQTARKLLISLLVVCSLSVAVIALALGGVDIKLARLFTILFHPEVTSLEHAVIWQIRLPRLVLAMFVGAGLAACGAAMQAIFRNPLADPGLIGISSGAALGAIATIVLGSTLLSGFVENYSI